MLLSESTLSTADIWFSYAYVLKVSRFVFSFSVSVGWAVGRAHGFGPLFAQKTDVHGSPVALVFISGVSSAIAGETTMALNICASILVFQVRSTQSLVGFQPLC